jgi:hypothetical protein
MLEEVAMDTFTKVRNILLVKSFEQAEKVSTKLRDIITEHMAAMMGKRPVLRPAGQNPNFIRLSTGGWVFVWPIDDLEPDESLGDPTSVYWPTEGGQYERVPFATWRKSRLEGNLYRPVTVTLVKREGSDRPTVWDRILEDD